MNIISTWFYKESKEESSYYPQVGFGNSPLAHSLYMKIQVPFFTTIRHYNPSARLIFFTNLDVLPEYLGELFKRLSVEVVKIPYTCKPPQGWHDAWTNQFYVYDILKWAESHIAKDDVFLVTDADCVCHKSLNEFFLRTYEFGAGLYDSHYSCSNPQIMINGITAKQLTELYYEYKGLPAPEKDLIAYYGGEFIAFRGDTLSLVNQEYAKLWAFNLDRFHKNLPKLNEEALLLSVLVKSLGLENTIGNDYVNRIWTTKLYYTVKPTDFSLALWHMPSEKKRGLYRLYRYFTKHPEVPVPDEKFWQWAGKICGLSGLPLRKRLRDRVMMLYQRIIAR